ncbi:MAG TPA: penicillin-binding protein 2 [Gaiellaceae bacterium]|nr:penicillin-binding protein 2 [Gaiellaceae bacterium]
MRARIVNSRLRLLLLLIVLTFGGLLARSAYLQTVQASTLSARAQYQTKLSVVLPASRGTIFDRLGTPLAIGDPATDVVADPMQISNPAQTARVVARVLGVRFRPLLHALSQRKSQYYLVERQAPPAQAAALEKKNLTGFTFQSDERRDYPQGTVAAPLLGYMGVDHPLGGLETSLNQQLSGTPGHEIVVRDALGQVIDTQQEQAARDGHDVFLTIDSHIQAEAEQVLATTLRQWHAKDATAIVMDPRTGAILAMAQQPDFNANDFPKAYARGLTVDHAIDDVFEPGSVFKVVTIGGALAQHDITPNTVFRVPGSLQVSTLNLHDAEPHGTEYLKVSQILQRSSNIGTVEIAEKYLGEAGLKKWMGRFGFGQPTGIDFPGESPGILPSYWSGPTIGNVPIGQGVSVTALQLASVYSAIANNGLWIQPHVVDHVLNEQPPKRARRRILPVGVDHQLRNMLRGVVSDQGTAVLAKIPGYTVAGKTGTAQKPGGHGYIPGAYVATFVGMVPASNPRLVVLVSVDEPHGQIYGGLVAAPAFEQIASFDLQYLEVPPDLKIP